MTLLETPAFYDARPTITMGENDEPELTNSLLSLLVRETIDGLFRCEATFGNWGASGGGLGFTLSDRRLVDFGAEFEVRLGAGDKAEQVFTGVVTALESRYPAASGPELVVLAEDRLQELRMTRRTRTFEDVTDAEAIERIASDHSLQHDISIDGPTHRALTQVNQSDLAFVRDRARLNGVEVWLDGSTLRVAPRLDRANEAIRLTYGANLTEASVLADLAHQRTSVTVGGWDVGAKAAIAAQATSSAVSAEVGAGDSGIDLLETALGPQPHVVVGIAASSEAEAQAAAEADLRARARRFVTGHASCEGDARLRVGAVVELVGLGPGFSGQYHLVEVDHHFDGTSGYRTEVRFERPGLQGAT